MQKQKKIILILIILTIVFIGILVIMLQISKETSHENSIQMEGSNDTTNNIQTSNYSSVEYVRDYNEYYMVQDCVNKFIDVVRRSEISYIGNMIDPKYIKDKNISTENLYKIADKYNISDYGGFAADKISYIHNNKNYVYFVKGKYQISDEDVYEEWDLNIIIHLDKNTNTFKIIPEEPPEDLLTVDKKYLEFLNQNIEYSPDSECTERNIKEEEIARDYFMSYIFLLETDIDEAYNTLDKQYSKEKFENLEEFKNYIKNTDLAQRTFSRYSMLNGNEYRIFIIEDDNGREYIFKENLINSYTVMLDDYTVLPNEMINSYERLLYNNKAEYNVENFIQMLNNKDYEQAYSCLDEDFKVNNFSTQKKFVDYITNNTFLLDSYHSIEDTQRKNEYYIVKITGNNDEKELILIVKLGDKMDFKLSFNV